MDERRELTCLKVLSDILAANINPRRYSINKYKEGKVCIQKENNNWVVYVGERGEKDSLSLYDNIIEACFGMFRLLALSKEVLIDLKDQFIKALLPEKTKARLL